MGFALHQPVRHALNESWDWALCGDCWDEAELVWHMGWWAKIDPWNVAIKYWKGVTLPGFGQDMITVLGVCTCLRAASDLDHAVHCPGVQQGRTLGSMASQRSCTAKDVPAADQEITRQIMNRKADHEI